MGDFRERIERETIRGRYGVFHETIEMYLNRQWRAFTVPRFGIFVFGSYVYMIHGMVIFKYTFPNLSAYRSFSAHPNYKMLGPVHSYFYLLRPVFWTYIFCRMAKTWAGMINNHWNGRDDLHHTWYNDTNYPDLLHDHEDMRYINFRYSDQRVVPDALTGYTGAAADRYDPFLNHKEDTQSVAFRYQTNNKVESAG